MKLENLSALELGALVRKREISPIGVLDYFRDRIEKYNPCLNAFTYTMWRDAFEEAGKLEVRLSKKEPVGLFAGVPVGLKDFLPSKKGWTNSHGGVKSLIAVDDADSMFYTAARELDCIAVGKTNAPPFGFSGCCQNKMYGQTHNPFNTGYTSGGSSGGSAAAVAAGLIPLAEGGDAGGSIRIPAGWCNLFGFKPSLGTVPSYCRPDGWSATHPYCFNGSLTKTVADSAVMLNYMAVYDPRDPISLPINSNKDFLELMKKSVKGMKIGFTFDFDIYPAVDPEVAKIVQDAVRKLIAADVFVDVVHFNFKHSLEEIMHCWAWSISVDTALDLDRWKKQGLDLVKDHRDELTEEFIHFNDIARNADIFSMRKFNEIRTDILDNFEDAFEHFDFIVSPTAICPPIHNSLNGHADFVNGTRLDPAYNFLSFGETPLANFVGYPAASLPAGLTKSGLPVGLQVIGKQYCDDSIFALADKYEQINPWRHLYPQYD